MIFEGIPGSTQIQFLVFVLVLLVMTTWEALLPRRSRCLPRRVRWLTNLGVAALNRLLLSAIPLGAVAVLAADQVEWALFNTLNLPMWAQIVLTVLLLDAVVYWQHRLFHRIPFMWRVHRMHHTDIDFDVTTALRFHPLEALVSMLIKSVFVVLLAPPVLAVVVFEVVLNATAMFNHSNARLALGVDRWLRLVLVTPDMHRVHHSVDPAEFNSNFGFNLPWWDRLFGSYLSQPRSGHEDMQIGLQQFRAADEATLARVLTQPFR